MEQIVVGRVEGSVMNVPVDHPRALRGCPVDYGLRHVVLAVYPAPYSRSSCTTGPALTLYYSTVLHCTNMSEGTPAANGSRAPPVLGRD